MGHLPGRMASSKEFSQSYENWKTSFDLLRIIYLLICKMQEQNSVRLIDATSGAIIAQVSSYDLLKSSVKAFYAHGRVPYTFEAYCGESLETI